jgi:hypothetical protein
MKVPKYNSNKTYKQLITKIKNHKWAIANGDTEGNWSRLDGLEKHIVNYALQYLILNLKDGASYEALYDYVINNDPNAETSKFYKQEA